MGSRSRCGLDGVVVLAMLASAIRWHVFHALSEVVDAVTATMRPASAWIWLSKAQGEGSTG